MDKTLLTFLLLGQEIVTDSQKSYTLHTNEQGSRWRRIDEVELHDPFIQTIIRQ